MPLSHSLEDYLETIALLAQTQGGHAHANEIAIRLNVRMPSVTTALKTLCEKGFITYQPYKPITLTDKGRRRADQIILRHSVLKVFFESVLCVEKQEADLIACQVEHLIGNNVTQRLGILNDALLSVENECIKRLRVFKEHKTIKTISLDELEVGEKGMIVEISEGLPSIKKFAELGVIQGTTVKMEKPAPFGDPLRIKVMGSILSFRKSHARYIQVVKTQGVEKK